MSTTTTNALDHLDPIGLDELNAAAALQTRVDRKYIVRERAAGLVLDALASALTATEPPRVL